MYNSIQLFAICSPIFDNVFLTGYSFDDPKVIKFLEDAHKLMVEEALVKGSSKGAKIVDFVQPHLLQVKYLFFNSFGVLYNFLSAL